MAAATGMSQSAMSRIWRAFARAPHRSQTFKLSTGPLFIDRVRDVVGLYLGPPEKALVLCVDEKSRIQALDRSQPVLPMVPGFPNAAATITSAHAPRPVPSLNRDRPSVAVTASRQPPTTSTACAKSPKQAVANCRTI
ncbi:hypothetical protein SHKM778_47690 [Streptomyces sp. KM77-8]|uniref:Transposase n=1 Tax=Streptomyces haneummycinicus TaxID=3074435 RepID=A0AAT9HM30_9ACTN